LLKTLLIYLRLNFRKLALYSSIRSAKDYDRMRFEFELSKVASKNNYRILYVGIHERSFVYQLTFPFIFIDISNEYLLTSKKNVYVKNCLDIEEDFDLVILSGIYNYGTNSEGFKKILRKRNFKNFLILDWIKNYSYHKSFFTENSKIKKLKRSFFYYTHFE